MTVTGNKNVGAAAPDLAAHARPEMDDAPEFGAGTDIKLQAMTDCDECRFDALASQGRLVWEAELGAETGSPAVSDQDRQYSAAWEYWIARDTMPIVEANLLAVDNRPLPADVRRRRRRRDGIGGSPASAANGGLLGAFPKRHATVIAEVLARLLDGEKLTGMDAVFGCSTTRLADHVHQLRHRYGWRIEGKDVEVRTKDARVAQVSEYRLPHEVIEAAVAAGGAEFCARVHAARARRRAGAGMSGAMAVAGGGLASRCARKLGSMTYITTPDGEFDAAE